MALCETVSIDTDNRLTGIILIIVHNLILNKKNFKQIFCVSEYAIHIYKMNDL